MVFTQQKYDIVRHQLRHAVEQGTEFKAVLAERHDQTDQIKLLQYSFLKLKADRDRMASSLQGRIDRLSSELDEVRFQRDCIRRQHQQAQSRVAELQKQRHHSITQLVLAKATLASLESRLKALQDNSTSSKSLRNDLR